MKNNKNKVVRAIILNKEGKVLLGKRTQGKGAGGWALVGGKPEENETPEATIVREVQEELGIKFNPHFYFEETDKEPFPGEFWDVVYFQNYFAFQSIRVPPREACFFVNPLGYLFLSLAIFSAKTSSKFQPKKLQIIAKYHIVSPIFSRIPSR